MFGFGQDQVVSEDTGTSTNAFDEGLILIIALLMIYMGFEAFKRKYKFNFGHETSIVTMLGFILSLLFY